MDSQFKQINTRCPSCQCKSLAIGSDGHLVCMFLECKDPTAINRMGPSRMEQQLCELANANFKRDLASRLKKLGEEFSELVEAVMNGDRAHALLECADVSFVTMDIAQLLGGSLSAAQEEKWKILKDRQAQRILHKEVRIAKERS